MNGFGFKTVMYVHCFSFQSQRSACKKHLLSLKEMAKSLKDEYNSKEELKEQLKKEFAKLSRANKRYI